MVKLLVIGAAGLVGSTAVRLGKNYQVFKTFNSHDMQDGNSFKLDVTNRDKVFALIEKIKPDFIIDAHALHDVDYCETHPEEAWRVNVEGTKNVAEACKRIGAKLVYMSTDYIFDGRKLKYTEKDKPNPLNYYSRTKLIAERVIDALGVNHIIARSSVLYGIGGQGKMNFVLWLISKLKNGEKVNIVTDQHNNPTYVDKLVETIFTLYEKDAYGTFHVTGTTCLSRFDFAKIIANTFGLNSKLINPITTPELHQVAKRPERVNMITDKVKRISGHNPLDVYEGLQRMKEQMVK